MSYLPRKQQVLLVRHGETEWSRIGAHTSQTDIDLTALGREQAAAIGKRIGGHSFAAVLASPLRRALETARLSGLSDNPDVTTDLREWDYGQYEGRTTADIVTENPDWILWRDGCPDGESPKQVQDRAERVIESIRTIEGDVAVVSHGHFTRVLGATWVGLNIEFGAHLALDTAALSVLSYERETPVLMRWNDSMEILRI